MPFGTLPERLGIGLQNRGRRFESARYLNQDGLFRAFFLIRKAKSVLFFERNADKQENGLFYIKKIINKKDYIMSVHNVLLSILFFIGIITSVRSRLKFEKDKQEYDAKYISLFRQHNTMMIIIYIALLIEFLSKML